MGVPPRGFYETTCVEDRLIDYANLGEVAGNNTERQNMRVTSMYLGMCACVLYIYIWRYTHTDTAVNVCARVALLLSDLQRWGDAHMPHVCIYAQAYVCTYTCVLCVLLDMQIARCIGCTWCCIHVYRHLHTHSSYTCMYWHEHSLTHTYMYSLKHSRVFSR